MMSDLPFLAKASGGRATTGASFDGIATDSRSVAAGQLFVALRGERFDGHDFIAMAAEAGAAAAMVDRAYVDTAPDAASLPLAALRAAGADARGAQRACLSGGDDYELLFAAPPAQHAAVRAIGARLGLPLHCIGRLTPPDAGLTLIDANGRSTALARDGFDHFAPPPA